MSIASTDFDRVIYAVCVYAGLAFAHSNMCGKKDHLLLRLDITDIYTTVYKIDIYTIAVFFAC